MLFREKDIFKIIYFCGGERFGSINDIVRIGCVRGGGVKLEGILVVCTRGLKWVVFLFFLCIV